MPRQKAHTNFGILVDIPFSHRITIKIMYDHKITIMKTSCDRFDLIIKNPGSACFNRAPFSFFQCYNCHILLFYHIAFYTPVILLLTFYRLFCKADIRTRRNDCFAIVFGACKKAVLWIIFFA